MRSRPASSLRLRTVAAAALASLSLSGCLTTSSMAGMNHDITAPPQASAAATGQPVPAGTTVETFTTPDGTAMQYVQVVPPGRVSGAPGKVLIAFPPGDQTLALTQQLVAGTWAAEAATRGWVVVSPVATAKGLYSEAGSGDLVQPLLAAIEQKFPPEGGKFDLAGVSNGGLSAFRAALGKPEAFRSLVVFPGMPLPGSDPALTRLEGVGAAFFVGAQDTGWLTGSRTAATALQKLGNRVQFTEVPGAGHVLTLTGKQLFDAMQKVRG
jgi:acetyl esterase/lipase